MSVFWTIETFCSSFPYSLSSQSSGPIILFLFLFLKWGILRYNFYIMKFTLYRYTTLINVYDCVNSTTIKYYIKYFHYPKKFYVPLYSQLLPPPQPLVTTDLISIPIALFFSECPINGVIQYVVWLLSPNIMLLRFIHDVVVSVVHSIFIA